MARMLKCPRCKQNRAEKRYSYNPNLQKNFTQKKCYGCGFEGKRKYYLPETPADHEARMERMRIPNVYILAKVDNPESNKGVNTDGKGTDLQPSGGL